jgi:PAS domain S-box-containing protein
MKKDDNEKNKPLKAKSFAELEKALQKEKRETDSVRAMNRRLDANVQQLMAASALIRANKHQLLRELLERKQVDLKLGESEGKYRALFHSMMNGFSLHEIVLDKKGKPVDYIYLEVNKAAEKMLHVKSKDMLGKRVTEVFPGIENDPAGWIKKYGKVAQGKGSITFENYSETFKRWYSVYVYSPQKNRFATIYEDITERKNAEKSLEENEAKLRNILKNTSNAIYSHTRKNVLTYMSPQFKKILGYTPQEAMVKWTEFASNNPINEEGFKKTKEAIKTGKVQPAYELELIHKNGKKVFVEIRENPIVEKGKTVSIVGSLTDISERKKAEDALKKSEVRFKSVFETAVEGILIADSKTKKFSYANSAICKMLGYSKKEITGMSVLNIHPKKDLKNVFATFEKQAKGEISVADNLPCQRKDGTIFYVDIAVSAEIIDGKKCNIGFFTDITERKKTKAVLLENEEIFKSFMEHSPIHVFFKDENIRALRLSDNYEDMLGKPISELLGKTMGELFPSNIAKKMVADDKQILKEEKEVEIEEEFNGRVYSTIKFPVYREGQPTCLAGYSMDITERKKMLADLLVSREKFYKVFQSSPSCILITHLETGKIINMNSSFERTFGYEREEIINRTTLDIGLWKNLSDSKRFKSSLLKKGYLYLKELEFITKSDEIVIGNTNFALMEIAGENYVITTIADITESKKTQEELVVSEEKFYKIFDSSPSLISITNLETGKIIDINSTFERVSGYKRKEILGKTTIELGMWKKALNRKKIISAILKKGYFHASELEFINKSNEIIIGDVTFRLMKIGEENCLISTVADITERKMAERELSEVYNIINHNIAVTFLWKNERGWPVEFVSENVQKLTGYSRKEFIEGNISYADIIHSDDIERVVKEVAAYSKKIKLQSFKHSHYRIITKSGDIKWVNDTTYTRRNSHKIITHHEGIVYDITERKEVEDALKLSEVKYRELFEESIAAIYLFDTQKNFIDSNQAGLDLLGYTRKELLKLKISDVDADVKVTLPAHKNLLKGGNLVNYEHQLKKKNGTIITVLNNSRPFKDAKGNIVGMQSTLFDITDRKKAEKIRTTLSSMDDLVFVNDKKGIFIEYYQTSGNSELYVPAEVFLGKTYKEVLPAKVAKLFQDVAAYVISTGRAKETEYSLDVGGKTQWYCAKVSKRKDNTGKFSGVTTVARNITKSKLLEKKLKESDKKNIALLELTGKGYLILDGEGKVIDANQKYINLSGHKTLKEILGRNIREWLAVADREKIAKIIKKCLAQGFVENVKINYIGKKDSIIPVEFSGRVVKNDKRVRIITICSVIKANKKH